MVDDMQPNSRVELSGSAPAAQPGSGASTMAKDCPSCGLVNPPGAQRCDCGYDFGKRRMERSYLQPKQMTKTVGVGAVGIGGVFLAFAIIRLVVRLLNELSK